MIGQLARSVLALTFLVFAFTACGGDTDSQDSNVPPPAGQVARAVAQLDTLASDVLEATEIPGLAIAVVHNGQMIYAKGFGVRKQGESAPINADTVFQLASLSKPLGATVVARQVGLGGIRWDTHVTTYLPWFSLRNPEVTRQLTIGDLYAHRSGLPTHAGDDLEDIGYDRRQVLERLRYLPLGKFREDYVYTNFGLTAAAQAVAVAAGSDWATLAEQALYLPLGMNATSSRFDDYINRDNRAAPHVREDGRWVAKYQRQPDAQSPAGGVSSSVHDLARWMTMVLQDGQFEGKQIVEAAALEPAITPQILSSPPRKEGSAPGYYGYGFNVGMHSSGRITLSHSGAFMLGAATAFTLVPSANLGIVVLTNAAPVGAPEALAMQFVDLALSGQITEDWVTLYSEAFAPMLAPEGELVGQAPPTNPSPPADASAYLGTYGNDYLGIVDVVQGNDGLSLTLGPARVRYTLHHWDGERYVFYPSGESANPGSMSQATFGRGPDGLADRLSIEMYAGGTGELVRR